ncbi:MAG: hypothetical protein K8F91_23070, partial [Candidatus Obscuribacterales bacterium]|nr:hypothetical protein [Candidatus Obscuribacterales bacterium]
MVIKHFALISLLLLPALTACTGKAAPEAWSTELQAAEQYFENGQMEKASENLSAGLEIARHEKVPEKELCPYLLSLSRCYLTQGKTDEAALVSRQALCAARDKFGLESMALVPYLLQESRAKYKMKDFQASQESALKALCLQEKNLGQDAEELIETFNLIVSAACADDHCVDTEPYIKRQLDLRRRYLGSEHPH